MAEAKIELKAGGAEFAATGDQQWVSEQLDKFLENVPKLASVPPESESEAGDKGGSRKPHGAQSRKSLATHLKEKGATSNQTKKFLQTAIWLAESQGKHKMTTRDISDALREAHQSKLSNPAQSLNNNVNKGHCEKDGNQFFVTEEGKVQG